MMNLCVYATEVQGNVQQEKGFQFISSGSLNENERRMNLETCPNKKGYQFMG